MDDTGRRQHSRWNVLLFSARLRPEVSRDFVVCCHDWQSEFKNRMSAVDLATSHLSPGSSKEFDESDIYEPAASTLGSRYKRVFRSKSSVAAVDRHPNSDLKVVKLEVKPQPAGCSGLLAAQLKGYAIFEHTLRLVCRRLTTPFWPFVGLLHTQTYHCQPAATVCIAEKELTKQKSSLLYQQLMRFLQRLLSPQHLLSSFRCLLVRAQGTHPHWQCLPSDKIGASGVLQQQTMSLFRRTC